MIIALIILGTLSVLMFGFVKVYKHHSNVVQKIDFAREYRNKFLAFSNNYLKSNNRWNGSGDIDNNLYVWLTKNVCKIQEYVGSFGVMKYKPAHQNFMFTDYQIIINTIPKFRNGQIERYDVVAVDDCLLRYIGYQEGFCKDSQNNLKNPIIWLREGFSEILSIPILILKWFGIISTRTVNSLTNSWVYKITTGLIALVSLVSCIVTIIVGYDQTYQFISKLIGK